MSFTNVLENAGRSFLRAFVASFIVFAPGLLKAPGMHGALLMAEAASIASLTAGFRALQDFVPQLQFNWTYAGYPVGDFIGSFVRGTLASFLVLSIGLLTSPTFSFSTSAITGVLTGALAAGILAVQKFLDKTPIGSTPQAK